MDLLFAQLAMSTIPDELDVTDNNVLRLIDPKSLLSLNGVRVVHEVLSLVPNVDNFRTALRCMKLWAKRMLFVSFPVMIHWAPFVIGLAFSSFCFSEHRLFVGRGLYGNAFGLLGGIAYAILVARVCQMYPNAAPSVVVARYFKVLSSWRWPSPIILRVMDDDQSLGLRVWNPNIYNQDLHHLMPIITPAYPQMNTTHNVSMSQMTVMLHGNAFLSARRDGLLIHFVVLSLCVITEFKRGETILNQIMEGKAPWERLFERLPIFRIYRRFLRIEVFAKSEVSFNGWCVASVLRFFSFLTFLSSPSTPFPVSLCTGRVWWSQKCVC